MQRRIFTIFIALVLVGVLTTTALTLNLFRINYLNDVEEKLVTNGKLIANFLHDLNDTEGLAEIDYNSIAVSYANSINARVTFIDKNGSVIGDSSVQLDILENHGNRPEVQSAFEGDIGVSKRYSESLDKDLLYIAIPFERNDTDLAVVRLSVPLKDIGVLNRPMLKYVLLSMIAGIFIAVLLGAKYVSNVTEPIRQLNAATKKIASGKYDQKVNIRTSDEIGELSQNFNIMTSRLEETVSEIQESNTKMKAILTSMLNGVIALDNSKRVIFINPMIEEIFQLNEAEVKGKHILEVVRNNVLDELIHKLISDDIVSKEEIEIFEPVHRILNVYSNPIRLAHDPTRKLGVVILIEDITEIRKLERMRKDFVANVSHELKTPLTSIRGFVETLKYGAAEKKELRDKFLDIIDIETERLTSLIQDLLLLSEIENKNTILEKEEIDTNKSIEEILQVLREVALKKHIVIVNKVNNNLPFISGNKGWFKQMLINLIDNAIKYTPVEGTVTVTAYSVNKKLILKVSDSGMGIDNKYLSRLFERFYRVDKARSRQVGGTGLGLAIVKHIVLSFNGTIEVKSEINVGTEFIITLPL